jgi:4-aminobutyrate aminotransferase / (S)-3-amino-2-methylpropionate transaminase
VFSVFVLLQITPDASWPKMLHNIFMRVAPKGLDQITTVMCGSCANEVAYKAVFMHHQQQQRGSADAPFSEIDLQSCMRNEAPGSPDLSILSFRGAFHGRTFGTLSTTRSKALHKVDIRM